MRAALRIASIALATGAAVITIYSPYLAPLLYGVKRWTAARTEHMELDYLA